MYKRCIIICLILLLSIQMYGCKPDVENEKCETNVQYDTECSKKDQPEMTDGKLQTEDTETSEELAKREALDLVDDRGGGFQHLSASDWLICDGNFYVKTEEEIYQEELPSEMQNILQEEGNLGVSLVKEENTLILECESGFWVYDFTAGEMKQIDVINHHTDWQVLYDTIYYIVLDEYDKGYLMAYNMRSGETKEIDIGEYEPIQFRVRKDEAIGIWAINNGNKSYIFWDEQHMACVPDEDQYFGWTYLYDYNENGIIVKREYQSSLGIGTKIYQIAEDGTISVLNSEKYCNSYVVPEGRLLFLEDFILVFDSTSSQVEKYDYTFSNKEELYWDINGEETMTFKGCFIQDEKIIGLWENKEGDLFEATLCI